MTNKDILEIALLQSSYDFGCESSDFLKNENVCVISKKNEKARKYLPLPFECDLVSYGYNIVAQTSKELAEVTKCFINKYPSYRCFETPQIYKLNEFLSPYDLRVCFMAEYFLPDIDLLRELPCEYRMKILDQNDFKNLYNESWSNALCKERSHLDVLGVGAYDGDELIALAGCSADCEAMYQIGIDVLPAYRRKGIASALTGRLALEILNMGKVPFYCAAWSNIASVRNAVKSGFRPSWVELTARKNGFVDNLK